MKKAQVTAFVIIATIIIGVTVLYFVFRGSLLNPPEKNPDADYFFNYMQNCLEDLSSKTIHFIGNQGGYYIVPSPKAKIYPYEIPHYWQINKSFIPEIATIEKEMSDYFTVQIDSCLNSSFVQENEYKIVHENPEISSRILDNSVKFEIIYPLSISSRNSSFSFKKFSVREESNFYRDYFLINEIIIAQAKDPSSQPIGFISNLAYKNNFNFDMTYLDDNKVIYTFFFPEQNKSLIYHFAAEYSK